MSPFDPKKIDLTKFDPILSELISNVTDAINKTYTVSEYKAFQLAYEFFNRELFETKLPQVLVTLQRKPKMIGHFAAEMYEDRGGNAVIHEIALNPDGFVNKTDEQILSTLVHEMVHVWQRTFGNPGRRTYHNGEWAHQMKHVGLYPSSTGKPGGKEQGEKMSHYIINGGPFQLSCAKLVSLEGFNLGWQSRGIAEPGKELKKTGRLKFMCPNCKALLWAKPGSQFICYRCFMALLLRGDFWPGQGFLGASLTKMPFNLVYCR